LQIQPRLVLLAHFGTTFMQGLTFRATLYTWNNTKLVHWPLMDGLSHILQGKGD